MALRLGLILSKEDAEVFWQNEKIPATSEQKAQLKEAQRIYQAHPIKF